MPYKTLIAALLLTLPLTSYPQPCHNYPCVIQKVKKALRAKDYTDAFLQLEAAAAYPGSKPEEVKALRQQLFDSINREKRQAVQARKRAEKAEKQALEEKERADQKAREAEKAKQETAEALQKAQEALANLQQSNARVVNLLLENAEEDVLELQYEDALEKIKTAAELGVLQKETATAYLEIVFWHNEAGHARRALSIMDSAAALVDKKELAATLQPLPEDSLATREKLRAALQQFDPAGYQMLWERYYPVMVDVPGGNFTMGCKPEVDPNCEGLETQHLATVSDFQMARTETTWWQYYLFCEVSGHTYESPGWGTNGDNPVEYVTWYDAVAYSNWVSWQLGVEEAITEEEGVYQLNLHSSGYRLPTEAEWEYAAKGGRAEQKYIYSGGNTLDSVGWCRSNSQSRTQPAGQLKANALGLHDMSGNVWEWCWDWYGSYPKNSETDYAGPTYGGRNRVLRGGSWRSLVSGSGRSSLRYSGSPGYRVYGYGFRLSRSR